MPTNDYTKTCFVIMPFGPKPVGKHKVNFDRIYDEIFAPAIKGVALPEGGRLRPARTDRDFFSGDIGHEMFQYIHWSRFAMADISGLNANVMYELGVRHSARETGTVIFRQSSAAIPFDINHIKALPYDYRPQRNAEAARHLIRRVLRESLRQNRLDSPVQISLRAQSQQPELHPILQEAENAIRRIDRPAAIAALRRALRTSGGNLLVRHRLGLMLKDEGQIAEALAEFDAATKQDACYAEAWREKGVAESLLSRTPGWAGGSGEASLQRAIELNPEDFDAHASLGGVLRRQKRFAEAFDAYERAAAVSSGHPYPLLMAMKMRARAAGSLTIDAERRSQLLRAERMRKAQAALDPPFDAPWCFFDSAEIRLLLGDQQGFLGWVKMGLQACTMRWQAETFRSALGLFAEGGVTPAGLPEGIAAIDAAMPGLP